MIAQNIFYCPTCSSEILSEWKGGPYSHPVPLLPLIEDGTCSKCRITVGIPLSNKMISWDYYHSPDSTGLPDYWILVTKFRGRDPGLPYFSEGPCPKCGGRSVLCQWWEEFHWNCIKCGVLGEL